MYLAGKMPSQGPPSDPSEISDSALVKCPSKCINSYSDDIVRSFGVLDNRAMIGSWGGEDESGCSAGRAMCWLPGDQSRGGLADSCKQRAMTRHAIHHLRK